MTSFFRLSEQITRERRARLRAERLSEHLAGKLRAANERLKQHADELSGKVRQQHAELATVHQRSVNFEDLAARRSKDLAHAHSVAQLAETRLRAAVESLTDGFAVYDKDQILVMANSAYFDIFRDFPQVRPGVSFRSILEICAYRGLVNLGSVEPDAWVRLMLERWEHDQITQIEVSFKTGHEVRMMDRRVPNGDYVSLARDITAAKQYQAQLQEAQSKAEEAARAKATFLANMSHEIRTPMNGVVGMADMLCDSDLDPEQRIYADTIRGSGLALLEIINDILDYSKMDAGRMVLRAEPCDLEQCIHEALTLLTPTARAKSIELILDYDIFLPSRLMIDAGRMRQVLTNLIGNAIKFTEEGFVMVRVVGGEERGTTYRVHLSVEDTGIGIAPEDREHIFGEFAQVEDEATRKFQGTGLGLAITRQIIDLMGGQMWLESELGVGSCFGVVLELETVSSPQEAPGAFVPSLPLGRAVIASDHLASRSVIARMLQAYAVNVDVARDIDGIRRLLDASTIPAMVLIDQDMTGPEALELARQIRATHADIPIIVLAVAQADLADALALGVIQAILRKPVIRRELEDTIRAVARTSLMGPGVAGSRPKSRATAKPRSGSTKLALSGAKAPDQAQDQRLPAARAPRKVASARSTTANSPAATVGPPKHCVTPPAPSAPLPDKRAQKTRLDILYVEDNATNRLVFSRMTLGLDVSLRFAINGKEAVDAVHSSLPDLVFMDISMPIMDGREATRRIRAMPGGADLPIIALSAHSVGDHAQDLKAMQVDAYIAKPLRKGALMKVLRTYGLRVADDSE